MRNTINRLLSKFRTQAPVAETVDQPPVQTRCDIIRKYSRRLLSPYVGVVQIAEYGQARALSLDGENWAIRYALIEQDSLADTPLHGDPRMNYILVATIEQGQLKNHPIHPMLNANEVSSAVRVLFDAVIPASVPFVAADRYEYWLLDGQNNQPLALLHSTADIEEVRQAPPQPTWIAMPYSQLEVADPQPREEDAEYVPPINYRLQQMIEKRAGAKPRAAWYQRRDRATDGLPPCLIAEDWENDEQQRLCDLYIERLAPRLLMLDGLPKGVRQRLEQSARHYVFDVERFYLLYPEVVDEELLNTARVEARLRRANQG